MMFVHWFIRYFSRRTTDVFFCVTVAYFTLHLTSELDLTTVFH